MHDMLTILTDVRSVCQSVCHARLKSAAARAVYTTCRVRGVIRYSLRQMPWPLVVDIVCRYLTFFTRQFGK